MAYPAVWVKSGIFGPTERQVTVVHYVPDYSNGAVGAYKEYTRESTTAMDGDILRSEQFVIPESPAFNYIYDYGKPTTLVVSSNDTVLSVFYLNPGN